jgi:mannose/fructose/N-acetylgalactosamine-specific phosphotransferase system component IIC
MREILPVALLGGVMGLDVVCFPQMMISRPLVAGTVAGAFVGNASMGVLVGVTLELVALATLPFGASRYPEWGSAAVVAGAIAGALTIGVLAGLTTAWVGGWTLVKLRHYNAWMARRRRPALDAGSRGAVIGLQLAGLTGDIVRAMLVTAVMYAVLFPISRAMLGVWTFDDRLSRAVVVSLAIAVAASAAWTIFHSARGARWYFAGGLAVGLALLMAR